MVREHKQVRVSEDSAKTALDLPRSRLGGLNALLFRLKGQAIRLTLLISNHDRVCHTLEILVVLARAYLAGADASYGGPITALAGLRSGVGITDRMCGGIADLDRKSMTLFVHVVAAIRHLATSDRRHFHNRPFPFSCCHDANQLTSCQHSSLCAAGV
jgi:hypothetical protein